MNTRKNEKPWHKNSANYLIVNSIFVVISVFFIGILFQDSIKGKINDCLFNISVLCGVIALFILIVTSEKTVHAVEEDDVRKYIAYMLPYNFGVLFLFISLDCGLFQIMQSPIWSWVLYGLSIFFWIPFFQSVYWHFTSTKDEFDEYISELEDINNLKIEYLPKKEWEKQRFLLTVTGLYCGFRKLPWPRRITFFSLVVIVIVGIFVILGKGLQDPQWLKKIFLCP